MIDLSYIPKEYDLDQSQEIKLTRNNFEDLENPPSPIKNNREISEYIDDNNLIKIISLDTCQKNQSKEIKASNRNSNTFQQNKMKNIKKFLNPNSKY